MNDAVELIGVTKQYKEFRLNHISLNIPKGCIMGLIGENGAGKTTLIKAMTGLIVKDSGIIKLGGMELEKDEIAIKEDLGVVLSEADYPEYLKAAQLSKIMRNIYKQWDEKLFFTYLDEFGISKNKTIKECSKGMKMKLSIAVALSHNAKILILDEATSGLDPVIRDEILDIFMNYIQDEEHTILFSSHITSDLEKIADYITFLHEGNLIFSYSKDHLIYDYGIIRCKSKDMQRINPSHIVACRNNSFGQEILIKDRNEFEKFNHEFEVDNAKIEEIMLFYIKGERA